MGKPEKAESKLREKMELVVIISICIAIGCEGLLMLYTLYEAGY
jgi:hypothetical protein